MDCFCMRLHCFYTGQQFIKRKLEDSFNLKIWWRIQDFCPWNPSQNMEKWDFQISFFTAWDLIMVWMKMKHLSDLLGLWRLNSFNNYKIHVVDLDLKNITIAHTEVYEISSLTVPHLKEKLHRPDCQLSPENTTHFGKSCTFIMKSSTSVLRTSRLHFTTVKYCHLRTDKEPLGEH